ncbi:DUF4276 family protein [Flavobacterium aquiphilum]|uniref:DUF4276 family protein n=1 Tax=Flavobacterium aquiphilum TaxID=3003261 RepID=UPI0024811BF1|nr:DUF4276 family protein [Flavobacterium aquiphilum]
MSNFILTGLFTEGTTDNRFLESVVKRTLEDVAFDCTGDVDVELEIISISKTKLGFNEQVLEASKLAFEKYSILLLFVHTDADDKNDEYTFKSKIFPAQELLLSQKDATCCKNMVGIVPIQMTESWMIVDRDLLKSEIGIEESDAELGIHLDPETLKDPKGLIEGIIRLSKEGKTKRKRNKGLDISDLYQIIGQKVELSELEKLSSYLKFKNSLIEVLKELNFYHK